MTLMVSKLDKEIVLATKTTTKSLGLISKLFFYTINFILRYKIPSLS